MVGGVFFEADLLEVSTRVVDAGGVLHIEAIGPVPAGVKDVVAGGRGLVEEEQAEIGAAAAHQKVGAADHLVGRPGVARAAFRFVVEDEGPVADVPAEAVVGREEERGAVLGGVVDQGAGADGESALHDEGHRALFALPGGAFRAVHIDVAVTAVAVGPTGCTEYFGLLGGLAGNVAVGVDHLVHAQGTRVLLSDRHLEFHDQRLSRHESGGQAAPILVVAVVKAADEFDVFAIPEEHPGALGQVEFREAHAHRQGPGGRNDGPPDRHALFRTPLSVLQSQVDLEFFTKPPWGTLDQVGDGIAGLEGVEVNGGKVLHGCGAQVCIPVGVSAMGHLGGGVQRAQQDGQQAEEGGEAGLHGWGFNPVQAGKGRRHVPSGCKVAQECGTQAGQSLTASCRAKSSSRRRAASMKASSLAAFSISRFVRAISLSMAWRSCLDT